MNKAIRVAQKELASYFSSPVAFLFIGAFLAINLFFFFWMSQFFSRNIADIRPLFQWMPALLIFLVGALIMRMWSEERRAWTIEFLLTLPVSTFHLALGKMFACLTLVAIALLLTLPLPITVSMLGSLDWGPVIGGYVASVFLAAAYISIGLYVSSRNDNQIVTLILTVLICLGFYLLGSSLLVPLVGNSGVEILQLLGSGSRFESITRGVLDIRDLYYYLSIVGVFLSLNVFALEQLRWENQKSTSKAPSLWRNVTILLVVNFIVGNVWLQHINGARVDLTANKLYSISPASKNYLAQLREPLVIRGYFSEKTHPLLAPLVPELRDLLREYEVVSKGKVRAEFIDPRTNPELEKEANEKYGIKPVPFQVSDKYDVSLINSYFDILILYGDKYEVINFQKLIDVKVSGESQIDVRLRNPEYDITRAIKKVLYGFQTPDGLFQSLPKPVTFQGYISNDSSLPEALRTYKEELTRAISSLSEQAAGKLQVEIKNPDEGGDAMKQELQKKYGISPVRTLFSPNPFYFSTMLQMGDKVVPVPIPQDLSEESATRTLEAALKRFSPGFLKTIGIVAPPQVQPSQYNPEAAMKNKSFMALQDKLKEDFQIETVDIAQGTIQDDIDLLLVLAPRDLSELGQFAIDQFLMKGGTVLFATSPFHITRTQTDLKVEKSFSGLEEWFKEKGILFENKLVLDPQNESYPIPVIREVAGFRVQEIQKVPYPLFVDIRSDGMNADTLITSGTTQVTMNWASPIKLEEKKLSRDTTTRLLKSSPDSWKMNLQSVRPDSKRYGPLGFPKGPPERSLLGVVVEGSFASAFTGKESPLLAAQEKENAKATENPENAAQKPEKKDVITTIIEKSPSSARIIVFSSNEFLTDQTLQISASGGTTRYLNTLQLIQNAVDWSLEDRGLLSIRGRGHFSRTLRSLTRSEQLTWEYMNYLAALVLLFLLFVLYRMIHRAKITKQRALIEAL